MQAYGLLGIGHAYAGRVGLGIGLMFGWWLYIIMSSILSAITGGLVACLFIPLGFVVPIVSGIQVRGHILTVNERGSWGRVFATAGGGCFFVVIAMTVVILLGGFVLFGF